MEPQLLLLRASEASSVVDRFSVVKLYIIICARVRMRMVAHGGAHKAAHVRMVRMVRARRMLAQPAMG